MSDGGRAGIVEGGEGAFDVAERALEVVVECDG